MVVVQAQGPAKIGDDPRHPHQPRGMLRLCTILPQRARGTLRGQQAERALRANEERRGAGAEKEKGLLTVCGRYVSVESMVS